MAQEKKIQEKKHLMISLLLGLIALVSLSVATVAWFSIADFTKVQSMNMEITSGKNLRIDLDAHRTFDEYVHTLRFSQIADRIFRDQGYDMREVPLEPVTTENASVFTFESGSVAEKKSGAYLEFVLHFMATDDMLVHLTSANSAAAQDGTWVTSSNQNLPQAMRISFTVGENTYIYAPGMGDSSSGSGAIRRFGLPGSGQMVLNDNNAMFWLKKDVDCPVTVHVWLEGTDPACTDQLRKADYSIQLRFEGTDKEHHAVSGDE